MKSVWALAKIDELEFAATATLLAIKAKGQSLPSVEHDHDGSSDENESEDDDEAVGCATSSPASRLATHPGSALIDKFLDRLAELFARDKPFPHSVRNESSKHIAATAWVGPDADAGSPINILVAKNSGLDDQDLDMLGRLQRWLRAVAHTGRSPPIEADRIWIGNQGLLQFSRKRLLYYISQFNAEMNRNLHTIQKPVERPIHEINQLYDMCRDLQLDSAIEQLRNVVNAAYSLRCNCKSVNVKARHVKALRLIGMIGRLQAAYECFKSVALSFTGFRHVEMRSLAFRGDVEVNQILLRRNLRGLCEKFELPKGFLESKAAKKCSRVSRLHVHAEMQILASLGENTDWHRRAHPYIGASKKTCFLCNQLLLNYSRLSKEGDRKPFFRARQSHGKVYPLWTIPRSTSMSPVAQLSLSTGLSYAYKQVQRHLQQCSGLQPAIAESSAGVTAIGSLCAEFMALKGQHLTDQRPMSPSNMAPTVEPHVLLGHVVRHAQVVRLPVDGSNAELVSIPFHALPDTRDPRILECGHDLVPDFSRFWGIHQFDRRFMTFEISPTDGLAGEYRLYWNDGDRFANNKYIQDVLQLECVDDMRRFWTGDVFIVRFSEQSITYIYSVHDVQIAIAQSPSLTALLKDSWQNHFLETQVEQDQYYDNAQEKTNTDKEIILQRMLVTLILCQINTLF